MIPRGAPYIAWSDLVAAAVHTVAPGSAASTRARLERQWSAHAVAALSVRTGLDAFLSEAKWPAGSEIIVSAVTIPHIVEILAHHKLVPVPVDLDPDTLAV